MNIETSSKVNPFKKIIEFVEQEDLNRNSINKKTEKTGIKHKLNNILKL